MMFAYIDPGLGQLIWLSIVSAFVGFVFYVKKVRAWAVGVWQKIFRRDTKSMDTAAEKTEAENGLQ
jgi:hypothetical protein